MCYMSCHTVTDCMLYGLRPARVSLANSSSLNQKNLSPVYSINVIKNNYSEMRELMSKS